jgi:hypothetical protein
MTSRESIINTKQGWNNTKQGWNDTKQGWNDTKQGWNGGRTTPSRGGTTHGRIGVRTRQQELAEIALVHDSHTSACGIDLFCYEAMAHRPSKRALAVDQLVVHVAVSVLGYGLDPRPGGVGVRVRRSVQSPRASVFVRAVKIVRLGRLCSVGECTPPRCG